MGDQGNFQGSPYNNPQQPRQQLPSSGSIGSQHSFHGEELPQDYQNLQPVTPNYQGYYQGSPYNAPQQPRQRLSSSGSIGSQHSFHGEEPQYYQNLQPVTPNYQMPLQNELNNLQLSHAHSQSSLSLLMNLSNGYRNHGNQYFSLNSDRSDSSFDVSAAFENMADFEYTDPQMDPLTGDPNVLWNQPNNPNLQTNYYTTDYEVNQPQMHQMNPNYQNEGYYEDDGLESTLTHASANNAQAVTTHPQQVPMMVYSNPASQEPPLGYYYQAPLSNTSADDYSNQGAGDESDTSERGIRRGRTSRSANRPYDRPASRSTSRNSNHSQSSSNQIQPAGRGRPAVYIINFNNLTESQKKTKKKIEDSEAYRSKANEEEKYAYLLERLQNNEAVRNSRLNKNKMSRDVLDFGEELYHAAQHVRQKLPGVENEIESLLERITRWEIDNKTDFVKKVNDLKPKPNEDNDS